MSDDVASLVKNIRKQVSVFDVMRRLGHWVGPDSTKQVRCIFHGEDRTPSARVYKDSGLMHCFVCARPQYDAIRYLQCSEQISFTEAVWRIKDWFGIEPDTMVEILDKMGEFLGQSKPSGVLDKIKSTEDELIRCRSKIQAKVYLGLSNYLDQIERAFYDGLLATGDLVRELEYLRNRIREG